MTKPTIWQRFGGWFRKTDTPAPADDIERLDADQPLRDDTVDLDEHTAVDPHGDPAEGKPGVLGHFRKKDQQVVAIEEGFNRLVQALETINQNVVAQRETGTELQQLLKGLPTLTEQLPQTLVDQQATLTKLADEAAGQNMRSQQTVEILKRLPELSNNQLERLDAIAGSMESAQENEAQTTEAMTRMDAAMQTVARSNEAQQSSLQSVSELLAQNEQRSQQALAQQKQWTRWIVAVGIVGLVVLAGAATLLILMALRMRWLLWT